jgi:hypothetical protein
MSFGSGSGSSAISNVRTGGGQQGILAFVLLAVAGVALIGWFLHKAPPPPDKPAMDTAAERLQILSNEAPAVKPIALEITPQVTRDWIALDGYQDSKGIDNLVIGIVKTAYRKRLGDTGFIHCFGSATGGWSYDALKAAVGSDVMDSVRAQIIQINEETRKQSRQRETRHG